jgi:hypothetical protein
MSVSRASLKGLQAAIPIPDVPDAPTFTVTHAPSGRGYNNGKAIITIVPALTGGIAASYSVLSSGGHTATGTSEIILTGLSSNTSYTFTAKAINSTANGSFSNPSSSITATTVPDAPTIGTATNSSAGNVSVTFTAPVNNGGASITGYTLTSSSGLTATAASSPITLIETVSSVFTYTVTATNANGTSAASAASNSLTISLVPGVPSISSVSDVGTSRAFNNGAASVAFTAGSGPAATSYTVTSSPGGYTASGASSPIVVTGLQSGTSYTYAVTATNAIGSSSASASSSSVTATTVPSTPTSVSMSKYTGAVGGVTYSFAAPISTGGKTITGYSQSGIGSRTDAVGTYNVSGLSQGASLTVSITATNDNGSSTAATATATSSAYTCSAGFTLSGSSCTQSALQGSAIYQLQYWYAAAAVPTTKYSCRHGTTNACVQSFSGCSSLGGQYVQAACGGFSSSYNVTVYNCDAQGGSLIGTGCYRNVVVGYNYSCPNGGSLSGSTCTTGASIA